MTHHTTHCPRRTALQTVTGAVVGCLAGCLSTNDTSAPPSGAGPIEDVGVEGTELVVKHTTADNVDQLNLIQPNGELFAQRTVAAGSQQASFSIGTAYDPGEYTVVALRGEERVDETTLSIEPDLEITEMGIGRNQPRKMWNDGGDKTSDEAFVTVENRGSGPESITKLLFTGDVPYPSDEDGTNYAMDEDVSGIYNPSTGSEADSLTITADEQLTLYSSRSPFAFVPGAGTSCADDRQSGEFLLSIKTRVGRDTISKTYSIQYSAATEQNKCQIRIGE